jgi:mannan endo-1,4-beta-mannosidase
VSLCAFTSLPPPGGASRLALAALLLALGGCVRKPPPPSGDVAVDATRERLAAAQASQRPSRDHLYVLGRDLFDRCGEKVVLRGINHMVIWTDPEGKTFPEIAKTSANALRIVWTVKDDLGPEALDRVLTRALENRLLPIIELHDATGMLGEVPHVVDFWVRPEVVQVLKRHEASLIVNIANEAGASGTSAEAFVSTYALAIARLRQAGLLLPLMIDAPGWGQDIDVLQEAAPELLLADPERNLLFSAHVWWVQGPNSADPGSTRRIQAELEESVAMNLPLVIGEFGHAGVRCARSIDYVTLLSEAHRHQIGWLAWSWGPGNRDCAEMDMTTDGRFATLRGWGLEVAVESPYGIQKTAHIPASIAAGKCAPPE